MREMELFDHFPEPVFYIQGGQIRYSNEAARALEPKWTPGCSVPDALNLEPDEEGVFSCALAGREFQASATRTREGGLLLVLRQPVQAPSECVLAVLPSRMRDIINNLQGAAQLISPLVEESGEEHAQRDLAVLNQGIYRLLRLARQLELAGLAAAGETPVAVRETVDLAQLCRETAYGAAHLAEQAGVSFREEVPGGVILTVGDRELLEVMLLELISNGLKAAGKGGEVGLRLTTDGRRVLITVWDNGPGMSQADLTAMMDGASPDSLPKPGTGLRLGLPIARCVAAAHAGAILLESREDKGLQATVSLPLRKPTKSMLHAPQPRAEESFSPLMTFLSDALPWQVFEE